MKPLLVVVNALWMVVGIAVMTALWKEAARGDITWWLLAFVAVWGFLCGLTAILQTMGDKR